MDKQPAAVPNAGDKALEAQLWYSCRAGRDRMLAEYREKVVEEARAEWNFKARQTFNMAYLDTLAAQSRLGVVSKNLSDVIASLPGL